MKVCPKCARSLADGFTYCPNDATLLERYDLRARVHADDEFHFLLESESLLTSLERELVNAADEMKANPRGFLRGLLRGEGSTRQRKRLLQAGFAAALIAYASIVTAALLVGLFRSPYSDQIIGAAPPPSPPPFLHVIPVPKSNADQPKSAVKSRQGLLGGSLRQPQPRRASGGGGHNDNLPASRGEMPAPTMLPQINPPDRSPPKLNAKLIVPETVYADDAFRRRINGPFGLRDGQIAVSSLGDGKGPGVGPGTGAGYGPGYDGNTGGKGNRIGSWPPTGNGNDDGVPVMSAQLKPTILYREKAKYTEEARQHRVQGSVVLGVVFGADGRIHNLRTIRGLAHGLTETAIEAAQRIRFQPAIRNGKPVSVQATLEFNFALY
jgi:TonB family protein